MKNKKGFTLAELLIVVAIIGVLVAISIPIFTTQLRKARLATNQANARAAYAAAVAMLYDNREFTPFQSSAAITSFVYDVGKGTATIVTKGDGNWEGSYSDYFGGTSRFVAISEWNIDTKGYFGSSLSDKTYKKWKIDMYNGTDGIHQLGDLYDICWPGRE